MRFETLYWLPQAPSDWNERLDAVANLQPDAQWRALVSLANFRMDFLRTNRLDGMLRRLFETGPPEAATTRPVRMAVLASSTMTQLLPAVRVGALRRGIHLTTYETPYGQYLQELRDRSSGLFAFDPDTILFSSDAFHVLGGLRADTGRDETDAAIEQALAGLDAAWQLAREVFGAQILQQTVLNWFSPLLGSNEHRLPASPRHFIQVFNGRLASEADKAGVDLVDVDGFAREDGVRAWHDPMLWHRAKQDISPDKGPIYGELVARLVAAAQGRSAKCLVLDLDNTLWGGVVGDDGLEGIRIGQGSAEGEAYLSLQSQVRALSVRGVLLAVCSKNDETIALSALRDHPDMAIRPPDVASFVANWNDKASNLRRIAEELNIGLDSLVFVDDDPFQRNLVRRELPLVSVPELPDDVAEYGQCIADAGYFEALSITEDDRRRTPQYRENRNREALRANCVDLDGYLQSLEMRLAWQPFDHVGLRRIVQLINKTNQFNLTTRRYTEAEITQLMVDPGALGIQFRLTDRFGDNGVIAIVIGRDHADEMEIDTWLMSCRVLGRHVEEATLNVVAAEAGCRGIRRLVGIYRPTERNAIVRDHYSRLNFSPVEADGEGGSRSLLDLTCFTPFPTSIQLERRAG